MAFRELTFAEMGQIAGGHWHTYWYYSSGGEQVFAQEWIDDYQAGPGYTTPVQGDSGSQVADFDNQPVADNDGLTIGNHESYLATASNVTYSIDDAYRDSQENSNTSGYDSRGDVFGDDDGLSGQSWINYALTHDVPRDAVIFGNSYSGDNSGYLNDQDLQGLGLYREAGDTYSATLNGVPVSITYHGVDQGQQTSYDDSVVVDGHYWTVSFIGSSGDSSSSLGIDVLYTPPANNPGDVSDRHAVYDKMNQAINGSDSHYHTHFFAAAANVTGITALGGAEDVSNFNPFGYPFSNSSVNALEKIGGDLYKYVNAPVFNALYTGNDNFVLHIERSDGSFAPVHLGDIARQGETAIDAALVMNEQYNVQIELQHLDSGTVNTLVNESNSVISSFPDQAMTMSQQRLGHSVNFASINDRIQLGYNEIAVAAASGH